MMCVNAEFCCTDQVAQPSAPRPRSTLYELCCSRVCMHVRPVSDAAVQIDGKLTNAPGCPRVALPPSPPPLPPPLPSRPPPPPQPAHPPPPSPQWPPPPLPRLPPPPQTPPGVLSQADRAKLPRAPPPHPLLPPQPPASPPAPSPPSPPPEPPLVGAGGSSDYDETSSARTVTVAFVAIFGATICLRRLLQRTPGTREWLAARRGALTAAWRATSISGHGSRGTRAPRRSKRGAQKVTTVDPAEDEDIDL